MPRRGLTLTSGLSQLKFSGCAMPPTPLLMRGGTPDFAGSRHWRPLLAPGPSANHVLSRPEPWGILDSPWRPFWAHSRQLSPISGLAHYLTYGPHCHFIFFSFSVTRQTAMPIRTAPRFCLGGYGRFEKLLYGCRDPSRLHVSGPWPVSDTQRICC